MKLHATGLALFWLATGSHPVIASDLENSTPSLEHITSGILESEGRKQANLREYSVVRRYILENKRLNKYAEMRVRMVYRQGEGKSFEILELLGSESVYKRVFEKLLEAEVDASKGLQREESSFTPRNYEFRLAGLEEKGGRRCYVLELAPKSKSKYLFRGRIWVDAHDFEIVRIEGRPAAKLSFWTGVYRSALRKSGRILAGRAELLRCGTKTSRANGAHHRVHQLRVSVSTG